ncbi:MAG: hypothetical protein OXH76_14430 [Boseongicola sp.]|nr:hypothetical protein [Boseongicola sp.]
MTIVAEVPRLIATRVAQPLRLALRKPQENPETQRQFRVLVERALSHEIRAGYTHRFITLMFVTVGDRVFCRRYTYSSRPGTAPFALTRPAKSSWTRQL